MGGIPCRLFFASARPLHGRCPRPVPTVLPLPLTGHLEESEVVVKRGTRASGGEISRGLFVFPSALGGESPAQGYSPIDKGLFSRICSIYCTNYWLCSDILIDIVQKMNHSSFLLLLQSFLGKSQQLILSGFDGGSPPFGFGIGHTERP